MYQKEVRGKSARVLRVATYLIGIGIQKISLEIIFLILFEDISYLVHGRQRREELRTTATVWGRGLCWHSGLHGSHLSPSMSINKATHAWQAKTQASYVLSWMWSLFLYLMSLARQWSARRRNKGNTVDPWMRAPPCPWQTHLPEAWLWFKWLCLLPQWFSGLGKMGQWVRACYASMKTRVQMSRTHTKARHHGIGLQAPRLGW